MWGAGSFSPTFYVKFLEKFKKKNYFVTTPNFSPKTTLEHKECARSNIFFGVEFCIHAKSENGVQQA